MPLPSVQVLNTVVVSDLAVAAIATARSEFPCIDQIVDGWKWRLAHDPKQGYAIPATNPQAYVAKSSAFKRHDIPAVRVLYICVGNEVTIRSIHIE